MGHAIRTANRHARLEQDLTHSAPAHGVAQAIAHTLVELFDLLLIAYASSRACKQSTEDLGRVDENAVNTRVLSQHTNYAPAGKPGRAFLCGT